MVERGEQPARLEFFRHVDLLSAAAVGNFLGQRVAAVDRAQRQRAGVADAFHHANVAVLAGQDLALPAGRNALQQLQTSAPRHSSAGRSMPAAVWSTCRMVPSGLKYIRSTETARRPIAPV